MSCPLCGPAFMCGALRDGTVLHENRPAVRVKNDVTNLAFDHMNQESVLKLYRSGTSAQRARVRADWGRYRAAFDAIDREEL